MVTRVQSFLNFIIVFALLLFVLAVISPSQFGAMVRILADSTNLIIIVIVIALIAVILRKAERI
jgi:hypothetical protein